MWVKKEQHLILHEVAKAALSDTDLLGGLADKLNIDRETMSELVSMVHGYLEQSLYDFEEYLTAAVSTAYLKPLVRILREDTPLSELMSFESCTLGG